MSEPPAPPKRRGRKPSGLALSGAERQRRYMERLRAQAPSSVVTDANRIAALERELVAARSLIERQKALISELHRDLTAADVKFERHERAAKSEAKRLTRERDEAREELRAYWEKVNQRASDAKSSCPEGLPEHTLLEAQQHIEQQTAIIATLHVQLSEADQKLARHEQAAKRDAKRLTKERDAALAELAAEQARHRVSDAPTPNPALEAEFQEWLRRGRPEDLRALDKGDAVTGTAPDRSERDRRLLELHQAGVSNREIARRLGIAESTVRSRFKELAGRSDATPTRRG